MHLDTLMNRFLRQLLVVGDALSQMANAIFLGGEANESISGRSFREPWPRAKKIIDILFSPFQKDHCKEAFLKDLHRARELVKRYTED